jgi:hypothetical protein
MAPLASTVAELDALKWRCIGPARGGRVVAVAGDPQDRSVFYFGACAGGVWKTGLLAVRQRRLFRLGRDRCARSLMR